MAEIKMNIINQNGGISMDIGGEKIYPALEDLEVTPSGVEQNFTHPNSYGYDKVKVGAVASDTLNVTPSEQQQQFVGLYGSVNVDKIPSEYVVPEGTLNINQNGTYNVTNYASTNVNIQPEEKSYKHLISYTLDSDAQNFTIPATEEAKKCTDFIIRVTGSLSAADWIYFSLNNASKTAYYNSKITSFDIVVGCAILEGFTFSDEKSLSRRYQFYNTFQGGGATINSLNSFGFCTYTTTITIVAGTQIEIYGM